MLRITSPADLKDIPKDHVARVSNITNGIVIQYFPASGRNIWIRKSQQDPKKDRTVELNEVRYVLELSDNILLVDSNPGGGRVYAYFVNENRFVFCSEQFSIGNVTLRFPDHFYWHNPKRKMRGCVTINGEKIESSESKLPKDVGYFRNSQNQFSRQFMTEERFIKGRESIAKLFLSKIDEAKTFHQGEPVHTESWNDNTSIYYTEDMLRTELGFVQHQLFCKRASESSKENQRKNRLHWHDFEGTLKAEWPDAKSQAIVDDVFINDLCTVTYGETFLFGSSGAKMFAWRMVTEGGRHFFEFEAYTFSYYIRSFIIDAENLQVLIVTDTSQLVVLEGFEPLIVARRKQEATHRALRVQFPQGISDMVMGYLGCKKPIREVEETKTEYNDLDAVAILLSEILKNPELHGLIEPARKSLPPMYKPKKSAKQQLMEMLDELEDGENIFEKIWTILSKEHVQKICGQLKKRVEKQVIVPLLNFEEVLTLSHDVRFYGMLLLLRQIHDLKKLGIQPKYPLAEMLLNCVPYLFSKNTQFEAQAAFKQVEAALERFKKAPHCGLK